MSIDGAYSYIYHWYGMRRLQQAVSSGIIKRVGADSPEVSVDPAMASSAPVDTRQKATYEHPFLGKNLDIMI